VHHEVWIVYPTCRTRRTYIPVVVIIPIYLEVVTYLLLWVRCDSAVTTTNVTPYQRDIYRHSSNTIGNQYNCPVKLLFRCTTRS
jgi:hypothetical protein